jgi:hypothetical protein
MVSAVSGHDSELANRRTDENISPHAVLTTQALQGKVDAPHALAEQSESRPVRIADQISRVKRNDLDKLRSNLDRESVLSISV